MVASTNDTNPNRRSSHYHGGSSRELRLSIRNLLDSHHEKEVTNMKRRSSLKDMDVPAPKVPNRRSSSIRAISNSNLLETRDPAAAAAKEDDDVIIEAVITRDTNDEKLGFSFLKMSNGSLVTSRIIPGGLAYQQTDLHVGYEILSINDVDCSRRVDVTLPEATRLLEQDPHHVVIKARAAPLAPGMVLEAVITRKGKSDKLGFKLRKTEDGTLRVTRTKQGGLAVQQTALRAGDIILSINNVDCTEDLMVDQAVQLLQANETVTLRAKKPLLPVGTIINSRLIKESVRTPIGMTLSGSNVSGTTPIKIKNIQHDSLAYHSKLDPGLCILEINKVDCRTKTLQEVQRLLSNAPVGELIIKARVPNH